MIERLFRRATRFLSDPRGGVSAMLALMMIPMATLCKPKDSFWGKAAEPPKELYAKNTVLPQ